MRFVWAVLVFSFVVVRDFMMRPFLSKADDSIATPYLRRSQGSAQRPKHRAPTQTRSSPTSVRATTFDITKCGPIDDDGDETDEHGASEDTDASSEHSQSEQGQGDQAKPQDVSGPEWTKGERHALANSILVEFSNTFDIWYHPPVPEPAP